MDIHSLIPSADAIPVHWGWLQFFLILTFILHLLLMNVMLGSGIMACVRSFRGNGGDEICREISRKLPYVIAFTINFGVAPLLFLQVLYGNFIYVSSVLMAVYWLSVIFILIAAYYLAYIYDFRFDAWAGSRTLLITASTFCLLVIGFIFVNNMVLMISPHLWDGYFANGKGTVLALSDPMLVPRYLHFVFASTAIAGLAQSLYWSRRDGNQTEKIHYGLKWFTHSTLIQIPVGLWFFLSLPRDVVRFFMGGNGLATTTLALGFVLTFVCLYFAWKKKLKSLTWTTLFTLLFMVLTRDFLRVASTQEFFRVSKTPVIPEYSPMELFILSLVIGLGLMAWMIRLSRNKEA